MGDGWQNQNMVEVAGNDTFVLKGTCMEMCPVRERNLREKQRRLHPFEVLQDSRNKHKPKADPRADPEATVKEFSRPAAGRHLEADELRPASVLVKTMDFLLRDILAKSCPWSFKCEFVSDRIRAIRQDLTAQHIITQEAVDILEKATRYYIVTAVQLCQEPMGNFDPVLHNTHTQECLKRLLFLYEFADQGYPNRPSFEACYLLYNLENPQVYYRLCQLPEKLRKAKVMQLAISLTKAYLNRNFVHVFRILMQLPFLESAAFFRHIQPIRCQALEIMNAAYSSKNLSYPLSSLAKIFYFETKDIAIQFCSDLGIRISDEKVYFSKGQFMKPEKCVPLPCHVLIGSKLKDDLTDVLLFHKQSGWDKNTEGKPEKLSEAEGEVDQLAILKKSSPVAGQVQTSMAGVCQEGLVSSQTGYMLGRGWGRGRGRARKKQPNIS